MAFCPAPFSNGCHVTSLRIRCSNHNFLLHVILSIPACFYSTWKLIYIQNMISFWLSGRNQYKASQRLKTRYGTGSKMLTTALPISFVYSSSRKLHRLKCYCVEEMHFPMPKSLLSPFYMGDWLRKSHFCLMTQCSH